MYISITNKKRLLLVKINKFVGIRHNISGVAKAFKVGPLGGRKGVKIEEGGTKKL